MDESIAQRAVESGDPTIAEEAFQQYDSEIQKSSNERQRAELFLGKAVLYGVFLRFRESRKNLDLALTQSPNNPDIELQADFIGASLYDQEGNHERAFESLTAVLHKHGHRLTTEPDLQYAYEDIQIRRGFDAVWIGQFREAIPLLRECLSFALKAEDLGKVLFSLGRCYSELGEYDFAREHLIHALRIGLTRELEGDAHMRLAIAYANLGFLKEAKQEFRLCEERVANYGLEIGKIYGWLSWVSNGLGERAESEKYRRLAHPS
jgi:tetratricopeptide (TPR) repeat protein